MTADSPIPCVANAELVAQIRVFAEVLKTQAHLLGEHGLDEKDFYNSGLFRGAIERIRGQYSATMAPKREFVRHILNYMQDQGAIKNWSSAGESNRHDYVVELLDGRLSAIELKGALDGNNTNIFERPPHVNEFIMWSISTNLGGSPPHNAWSGIHTRLSADIISRSQQVDGLIIWDWVCGTLGRPCPKVVAGGAPTTVIGPYEVPPPCIYLFPATVPAPRNNPNPAPQTIEQVGILKAFHQCFGGSDHHLHHVDFAVEYKGVETLRTTTIRRDGNVVKHSAPTPIQRT